MKCPFCQQELHSASIDGNWLECWNCSYNEPSEYKLPQPIFMGTKELWQALIDTKKKLDVAVDALKELRPTEKKSCYLVPTVFTTQRIIDEALEQINEIKWGK